MNRFEPRDIDDNDDEDDDDPIVDKDKRKKRLENKKKDKEKAEEGIREVYGRKPRRKLKWDDFDEDDDAFFEHFERRG